MHFAPFRTTDPLLARMVQSTGLIISERRWATLLAYLHGNLRNRQVGAPLAAKFVRCRRGRIRGSVAPGRFR